MQKYTFVYREEEMYWTSLTDIHAEGNFIWSNGLSMDEDLFSLSDQLSSSHYADDCVFMAHKLKQLDLVVGDCEQSLQYVCQYPAGG